MTNLDTSTDSIDSADTTNHLVESVESLEQNFAMPSLLPTIAILGRPNVGKSTLFNYLTRSRNAIVVDEPGVTRDRLYGEGKLGSKPYIVVDTGGIGSDNNTLNHAGAEAIIQQTEHQALLAAQEADAILFLVDARAGLMPDDQIMANYLRRLKKPDRKSVV